MKILKYLFLSLLFSVGVISLQAQKINWLTWEEVIEKSKTEKKKVFVDVYTDWCGWCKKMDKATFQKVHIAEYINEHYYAIKFDAEQKEDITLHDKTYQYIKRGRRGYHELAAQIMNGRLSYPTIVFLDEDLKLIQPIPGFQDAITFEKIMTYFAGNHHQSTPWRKYAATYQSILKKNNSNPVPVQTVGGN